MLLLNDRSKSDPLRDKNIETRKKPVFRLSITYPRLFHVKTDISISMEDRKSSIGVFFWLKIVYEDLLLVLSFHSYQISEV